MWVEIMRFCYHFQNVWENPSHAKLNGKTRGPAPENNYQAYGLFLVPYLELIKIAAIFVAMTNKIYVR